MEWTPQRRALAVKVATLLRKDGYSYEEIPDHMAIGDDDRLEPWEVYGLANPGKTPAQIAAWKARHSAGRPVK